jgi:hypothetical protein
MERVVADDYWVYLKDKTQKFRLIGGPIEQPEKCGKLFHLIGHAAASWARMEQHIDAILVQINKKDHSDELTDMYDPRHPGNFDTKIKLLKRYFHRHPRLGTHANEVNILANGLKKLSSDRNSMMHGILEDYLSGDDPKMIINGAKVMPKTGDIVFRTIEYPLERLHQFIGLVNNAHYALCEISKDLFTLDALAQLQRPK